MPRLCALVLGIVVGAVALLATAPAALAEPWAPCSSRSPADKTVRVFPRTVVAGGPTGTSSELQCGDRFSGYQRIESEWSGIPDWQTTADAAIGRALAADRSPVRERLYGTWTYRAPGVIVTLGARGLILDALPAAP